MLVRMTRGRGLSYTKKPSPTGEGDSCIQPPATKCPTRPQCPSLTSYAVMMGGAYKEGRWGHLVSTLRQHTRP